MLIISILLPRLTTKLLQITQCAVLLVCLVSQIGCNTTTPPITKPDLTTNTVTKPPPTSTPTAPGRRRYPQARHGIMVPADGGCTERGDRSHDRGGHGRGGDSGWDLTVRGCRAVLRPARNVGPRYVICTDERDRLVGPIPHAERSIVHGCAECVCLVPT